MDWFYIFAAIWFMLLIITIWKIDIRHTKYNHIKQLRKNIYDRRFNEIIYMLKRAKGNPSELKRVNKQINWLEKEYPNDNIGIMYLHGYCNGAFLSRTDLDIYSFKIT